MRLVLLSHPVLLYYTLAIFLDGFVFACSMHVILTNHMPFLNIPVSLVSRVSNKSETKP